MAATREERAEQATEVKVKHFTAEERVAKGKAARAEVPRASHSVLEPTDRDPVALLEEQAATRVPELVPIRYGRMLVSPFTFYRGAAKIMAHDLAAVPRSGLGAQLCGDAHLSNFGGFASAERSLVFDLNDFDEALPGPFEWDVKRLATSFEICARDRGFDDDVRQSAVLTVMRSYREAMRGFAAMGDLEVWYARLDVASIYEQLRQSADKKQAKNVARAEAKARTKDSLKALSRLTHEVDGELRIVSDPPLVVPIDELAEDMPVAEIRAEITTLFRKYRSSLQHDRRKLLEGYRIVDLARKVVGVGSVGTRAWILLMLGRDDGDPLFLQVKEAEASVLEAHLGRSKFKNHGQRVVEGQRLMQSASDIFLGWIRATRTFDGATRDYYVRQLWDWKVSVDLDAVLPRGLVLYAEACGWTLARAHARSGDRIAMGAYLGKGDTFDRAVAEFAASYADVNERDYEALADAVRAGRIQATEGL
ncbi:MAG TPA: DUF2252 domain-containing protein [Gaiellaceae bacterium]|nr:DUF2252 domain-containing protein [Gaiellaceae bacterium]